MDILRGETIARAPVTTFACSRFPVTSKLTRFGLQMRSSGLMGQSTPTFEVSLLFF